MPQRRHKPFPFRIEHNVWLSPELELDECVAVWNGEIEGFVYDDGEVWADVADLARWRASRAKRPLPTP